MPSTYDVAIVGGGPAGSTCARALVAGGARVVVIDRARFPRVKLCAGWLSSAIWDVLELSPREYPRALWEWRTCHVHFRGSDYAIPGRGWFIRRFELDDFLLQRSRAELRAGVHVKQLARDDGEWSIETPSTTIRARYLVGAGGTHCPVARLLAPPRPRRALGVQELELQTDAAAVERTRLGRDGEPELLLFDDVGGYGWNVPKSDWINIGCGTLDATAVHDAWKRTHDHLNAAHHIPAEAQPELAQMKGHSYFLYDPIHLEGAARNNALLVGDALGLAHPITGEGILPATVSGRVAAEAILAGDAAEPDAPRAPRGDRGLPPRASPARGGAHVEALVVDEACLGPRPLRGRARLRLDVLRREAARTTAPRPRARFLTGAPPMTPATATSKLLSSFDPKRARDICIDLLATAGITVGGSAPWDITIHDERVWSRVLRDGTLGGGEAYVDGWWDSRALDQTMHRLQGIDAIDTLRNNWRAVPHILKGRVLNLQTKLRAFGNGQHHYDIGNDLYEAMLDRRMLYTCALWSTGAQTLEEAQEAKLELVCKKIGLRSGMRILDLGCGWGGFAAYAAERYDVEVVGLTVSREQVAFAKNRYAHLPIDIRLDDYRNASGTYDAVVSIGLMEHVGPKNYRGYMELVDRLLAPGGVAFVHTIGGNRARVRIDPWFDKYVFPGSNLPSLAQLATAMEGIFIPEDVHNIGEDYDPTLMAWFERFDAAWPTLRGRYDEKFYRTWKFYLLASAGSFRARAQQLFQIVMTRPGTHAPQGRRG